MRCYAHKESLPSKHFLSDFVQNSDSKKWAVNDLRFPEKRNSINAVGRWLLLASGRGLRKMLEKLAHPYPHHKSTLSLAWLGTPISRRYPGPRRSASV